MKKFTLVFVLLFSVFVPSLLYAQGNALEFDGTEDYLQCSNSGDLKIAGDLTLEAWINFSALNSYNDIICQGYGNIDGTPEYDLLYLLQILSDKKLRIFWEYDPWGSNTDVISTEAANINANEWNHIAVTRDATTKKVVFYVNGQQLGDTVTYLSNPTDGSNAPFFIGAEWDYTNGVSALHFDGKIDEVRVWDTVRNGAEIDENMDNGLTGSESGLVGYYIFNETSGTTLFDVTSNNYDATLMNMDGSEWTESYSMVVPRTNMISDISYDSMVFSWNIPDTGIVESYIIDIDDNSDFGSPISGYDGLDVGTDTFVVVTGLDSEITYYARVRAYKSSLGLVGCWSQTKSATTEAYIVANCKDTLVYLDNTGFALIDSSFVDNGSEGDYILQSLSLDIYEFSRSDIGSNTVTMTVSDENGNIDVCTSTINIVDTLGPVLFGKSIEVFLNDEGKYRLTEEDIASMVDSIYDPTTSLDNIDIGAFPVDFSCVHVGKNPVVQLVAENQYGKKAKDWVTITVSDTLAPVFENVDDIIVELGPGVCDTLAEIDYPEIFVEDNCSVELLQIAGLGVDGVFPIGMTTETWVATDVAGNTDTLSFDIIVTQENSLPTLDSIADVVTNEDGEPVVVELTGISAGKDCIGDEKLVTVSVGSLSDSIIDSLVVDYVAGDSSGSVRVILKANMNGTEDISVSVSDEDGTQISQTFTLTVNPVNDQPIVVMPIPDQAVHASYVLQIPVSSVLGELFDDVDDDELEVAVMVEGTDTIPDWVTMSGDTLVCEPMIADTGCVNFVVMATDTSGATASDTFEVCVDGYPTAIGDISRESFEVQMYPNPTNGEVNITVGSGIHNIDVAVLDITGRIVLQRQYSASNIVSFDMTSKVAGMYFVNMNIDGVRVVKKLIVNNK